MVEAGGNVDGGGRDDGVVQRRSVLADFLEEVVGLGFGSRSSSGSHSLGLDRSRICS